MSASAVRSPAAAPISPLADPAPPTRLEDLDKGQKLAASLFVLSRDDMPQPPPPSVAELVAIGSDDVKSAVSRIRNGQPHRFANLFGSVGGTTGAAFGSALGKAFSDRGRWTTTLVGTVLGTYPPAIVGAVIDKIVDS